MFSLRVGTQNQSLRHQYNRVSRAAQLATTASQGSRKEFAEMSLRESILMLQLRWEFGMS